MEEYHLPYFFTLTIDPKNIPAGVDPWLYIQQPWRNTRTIIKREYNDFRYVAVLEKHKKNDRPHIHGFCNTFIAWEYWRRKWESCKGGNGVWLEDISENDNVCSYVSKTINVCQYVGKDQILGVPIHVRRTLWRSTKMKAQFELDKGSEWSIIKEDVYGSKGQKLKHFRLAEV